MKKSRFIPAFLLSAALLSGLAGCKKETEYYNPNAQTSSVTETQTEPSTQASTEESTEASCKSRTVNTASWCQVCTAPYIITLSYPLHCIVYDRLSITAWSWCWCRCCRLSLRSSNRAAAHTD